MDRARVREEPRLRRGHQVRLRALLGLGALAALLGVAFVISWPGTVQYLTTGQVEMHWSRAMLSSLLVVSALMLGVTSFLMHMLELIAPQRDGLRALRPPDRIRPARRRSA